MRIKFHTFVEALFSHLYGARTCMMYGEAGDAYQARAGDHPFRLEFFSIREQIKIGSQAYILYGARVKVHAFSTSRRLALTTKCAREVIRDVP